MSKIRVSELAEELKLDLKDFLQKLKEKGYSVKTASSTLSEEEVAKIREEFGKKREFIIIKKEKKEEIEKIFTEEEKPKRKKLIIKRKAEEIIENSQLEVKPEEISQIEAPQPEVLKPETIEKEEKLTIKTEEELKLSPEVEPTEISGEGKFEKRVVTDFRPRRERVFTPKPPKEEIKVPPPEEIEAPTEKEESKKKKKERFEEEKKKTKRKPPKRGREEREEFEFYEGEEEISLFGTFPEELEEEERGEKPKAKAPKERVSERPPTLPPKEKKIKIYESIQVGELAKLMGVKAGELIKKALQMGMPLTINQSIDADTAAILADEFGYQVEKGTLEEELLLQYTPPSPEELKPRPPVVTVMGHVDHGKTTLLDAIRKTDVASREAGGITQHIGAYTVTLEDGRKITFIDTPGHEAFTSMRARGAQVTDIVILVVAADDGVMDQTKEAIEHARAAGVPIVVAINKIDKPNANPERVKSQLAELGLVPEEWGGDTLMANISARNKIGIEDLLELVLLQAEMLDLKAAYDRPARGRVIESKLDKGKGPVATVIVQEGTLREGDPFVCGLTYGRVRAMFDSYGMRIKEATPSTPVEILGFEELPSAGDDFIVMDDEEKARRVAEYRQRKARETEAAQIAKISLEKIFEKLKEGELKELKIVLKADTQGTLEALKSSLEKLSTDKVRVSVIRAGIGAITESDVMLASASEAIVIGFNVKPNSQAKELAKKEGVDVRFYDVIYHVLEDIKKAMVGLLEPKFEEIITGVAEVRATFKVPKVGIVAGCYVKEGVINRNNQVRVIRDGVVVYTGKIASLKRFKEDVREVPSGYECGIKIENFNDVKEGDIIEAFEVREVAQEL
ncbi:MAG: translation initiation factor IF-2 [Caldimicrobium thiodismutans]|uniref:Translation initiation factor IF-2 n=1 Tax=Caldimicrobium thiodismutans TaxID=1653476 RepID=A0A2N7PIQ5_9BACT|nr:MAG: translation initiation factor IF-2 [Caldimicrobium thiodismutans]